MTILIGGICLVLGFLIGVIASEKLVSIANEKLTEAKELLQAVESNLELIERISKGMK